MDIWKSLGSEHTPLSNKITSLQHVNISLLNSTLVYKHTFFLIKWNATFLYLVTFSMNTFFRKSFSFQNDKCWFECLLVPNNSMMLSQYLDCSSCSTWLKSKFSPRHYISFACHHHCPYCSWPSCLGIRLSPPLIFVCYTNLMCHWTTNNGNDFL